MRLTRRRIGRLWNAEEIILKVQTLLSSNGKPRSIGGRGTEIYFVIKQKKQFLVLPDDRRERDENGRSSLTRIMYVHVRWRLNEYTLHLASERASGTAKNDERYYSGPHTPRVVSNERSDRRTREEGVGRAV